MSLYTMTFNIRIFEFALNFFIINHGYGAYNITLNYYYLLVFYYILFCIPHCLVDDLFYVEKFFCHKKFLIFFIKQ